MCRSRKLNDARKNGNQEEIDTAQESFNDYERVCLKADEISLNMTKGDLL